MPVEYLRKPLVNFIRGLNTEAGELTFPEDSSVDELNCDGARDGTRFRRLGVAFEEGFVEDESLSSSNYTNCFLWENVANNPDLNFLVVQKGATLYFYDADEPDVSANRITCSTVNRAGGSVSPNGVPDTQLEIDLNTFELAGEDCSQVLCEFAAIDGVLVVVSPVTEPFYLERNSPTEYTESFINIRVRDFDWQGDYENYYEQSTNTSATNANAKRKYDSQNCGWVGTKGDAALTAYTSAKSKYPPLTHPWYSGKDLNGDFDVAEWEKVYSGTSLISGGHFIVDFFDKVRNFAAPLGSQTESESTRFSTVCSFGGRVFYGGLGSRKNGSKIFFSRVLDSTKELGDCFQKFDPTSEELSDLLDNDGGVIAILEARNITKLVPYGSSILVFAENGIWEIFGVEDYFKANSFGIRRISDKTGLPNRRTLINVDDTPIWWSNHGIHTLQKSEINGLSKEVSLSITTVQTYWEEIDDYAKSNAFGVYDKINERVYWYFNSNGATKPCKYNKVLVLDIPLKAFYPWEVNDASIYVDFIMGAYWHKNLQCGPKMLVFYDISDKMTFAEFCSTTFLDWGNVGYESYIVGSYDFFGDMVSKKTSPYIVVACRRTENGFTGDEENGYTPKNSSSVMVTALWDYRETSLTPAQQGYRLKFVPVVNSSNLNEFDYPTSVILTKLKLRGRGRVVNIKFSSEQHKDFKLLGFEKIGAKNSGF